ncbi:unnamed protein product [Paramecium sonneborni]|uniref:Transmembrane protein n=1 Tax=Paramecium sonneborni TaxID=65129 RepID=A0A8S1JX95_9CILI|nr:unnamed protein product [Paramecium sonneborni]
MSQQDNLEEKSEMNKESNQNQQPQQDESKSLKKQYFTSQCKWISFSVTFLVLAGIGIFLGVYLTQSTNSAPTLKKFQRDEFQQVDEICMQYTSDKFQNCTQIEMNTIRVVEDENEQNATSLLILSKLRIRTFQQNNDGTREYNELVNQNNEIEQQIKKQLRILQQTQSKESDYMCDGIPQDECADVNEVPLLTVITDQLTGEVQQIGIPSKVSDLLIQPLISNIIHIAPNLAESANTTISDGTRLLNEHHSNLYYIGNQAFVPKVSKGKSWLGRTVVKKTISQSDLVEGLSQGINLFDKFEQSQETNLDDKNYLVSSHITTNSKLDNSIKSNDIKTDDLADKSETEISSESNLVTVETKSDEDLTTILSDIQSLQTIQYYTFQELQNKITTQEDQTQNVIENQQENNRLLQNENGDVGIGTLSDNEIIKGPCKSTTFNKKSIIKEVTVYKNKVGFQLEFSGELKEGNISGTMKACVQHNGICRIDLPKKDFKFSDKLKPTTQKGGQTTRFFNSDIKILGYPLNIGTDVIYQWEQNESIMNEDSFIAIFEQIQASLSIQAYQQINLAIIKIRAGLQGFVYKGNAMGQAILLKDYQDKTVFYNEYQISLYHQIDALTLDTYAAVQYITTDWVKQCIGPKCCRVCINVPKIGFSDWKDVYRKNHQISDYQAKKIIYGVKSMCN